MFTSLLFSLYQPLSLTLTLCLQSFPLLISFYSHFGFSTFVLRGNISQLQLAIERGEKWALQRDVQYPGLPLPQAAVEGWAESDLSNIVSKLSSFFTRLESFSLGKIQSWSRSQKDPSAPVWEMNLQIHHESAGSSFSAGPILQLSQQSSVAFLPLPPFLFFSWASHSMRKKEI